MTKAQFCTRVGKITTPGVSECYKFNTIVGNQARIFPETGREDAGTKDGG